MVSAQFIGTCRSAPDLTTGQIIRPLLNPHQDDDGVGVLDDIMQDGGG